MYRPKNPCNGCTERDLDTCLACAKWKEYKAKMLECYEVEHRDKSVARAVTDNIDKLLKKKHKQQGHKNFHYK